MFAILPAREAVSADEGEGGGGLVVAAGDSLQLQLQVELQGLSGRQLRQASAVMERCRQEVVRLGAHVLQQRVAAGALGDQVTPLLLLQRAQQGRLRVHQKHGIRQSVKAAGDVTARLPSS